MKSNQVVQLSVAMVILVGAGFLIFSLAFPHKGSNKSVTYEKVTPISGEFSQDALDQLRDKAQNFYVKPDLHSGIGNPQPFNPLR